MKITKTFLKAVKTALEEGTSIAEFLEQEEFDVSPFMVRTALIKEYGKDVILPLLDATVSNTVIHQLKQRLTALLNTEKMKGKKTKFKSDLKSMINAL